MPYEATNPLGRQLRSVLAALRQTVNAGHTSRRHAIASRIPRQLQQKRTAEAQSPAGPHHAFSHSSQSTGVQLLISRENESPELSPRGAIATPAGLSRRGSKRRTKCDPLTEALVHAGKDLSIPRASPGKTELPFWNANTRKHTYDEISDFAYANSISLRRILGSFIRRAAKAEIGGMERETRSTLSKKETSYLNARGYSLDDVQVWADIISAEDSHESATLLSERTASRGLHSVPLFVLNYVLRRRYISARALRILLEQSNLLLSHQETTITAHDGQETPVFVTFVRLLRHAREVWPRGLESIILVLLKFLPGKERSSHRFSSEQTDRLTHNLNKAMRLVAESTAIEPFKDNTFQEAAVVRILKFMAEHKPPLHINREGYRAVILIQLAQKKTTRERQWAELKALSWPPWKEERTAMDADISIDEHGTTKAGETLARMKEAGYAPLEWEKVASVYAGWDTDGTPTIQARVLLGTAGVRFKSGAAMWVARIVTTRTAQEAWAAFLAYGDSGTPPNQDVFLAMLQKLHKEDELRRKTSKSPLLSSNSNRERLFPGDTPEIQPLPPSAHLYTYTRTAPPTVEDFYKQIRERSIVLGSDCLGFLVSKAPSLKAGLSYLLDNSRPELRSRAIVSLESASAIGKLPIRFFAASVELFCRFSNVPISTALPKGDGRSIDRPLFSKGIQDTQTLSLNHCIVHAIELLKQRRPSFRPAWNSVIRALSREETYSSIESIYAPHHRQERMLPERQREGGALTAYRLLRHVLSVMKELHIDLDDVGLLSLSLCVENVSVACWRILRDEGTAIPSAGMHRLLPEAVKLLRSSDHSSHLKGEFKIFVCGDEHSGGISQKIASATDELNLPRTLSMPNPVLLHSYIRALGWMADYDGLLDAARWMVEYQAELAEKRSRDRNGELNMRKALVALRVFLERSWRANNMNDMSDPTTGEDMDLIGAKRQLKRLEQRAPDITIQEIRESIERVEDWAGWPTDDEVNDYCGHERFKNI